MEQAPEDHWRSFLPQGWTLRFQSETLWRTRPRDLSENRPSWTLSLPPLLFKGMGCKHGDRDFKDLLARVDGLRYAPKMRNQAENYFLYQCQSCGHTYRRKRRVNTQKFGCGLCQANSFSKSSPRLIFCSQKSIQWYQRIDRRRKPWPNHFYKIRKNRLVAGVVAGLADKFGWNLTLARV